MSKQLFALFVVSAALLHSTAATQAQQPQAGGDNPALSENAWNFDEPSSIPGFGNVNSRDVSAMMPKHSVGERQLSTAGSSTSETTGSNADASARLGRSKPTL
jgi:hypothetical protein